MDILNVIESRIENGDGYKLGYILYGLLRDKIGYINIEKQIPDINMYLNQILLASDTDTPEANDLMVSWIEWILQYFQNEPLDFIANNDMFEAAFTKSQFINKEEEEAKEEKEYQEFLEKKRMNEMSGNPRRAIDQARRNLGALINEARLLATNNVELQNVIEQTNKIRFKSGVSAEELNQAANALQEAMSDPY